MENLAPWTDYTFTLTVTDADGQRAATDLTRSAKTLDITAPEFQEGDVISVLSVGEDYVDLQWAPATDNVGVVRYLLSLNGDPYQVLSGEQNQGLARRVNSLA